MWTLETIRAGLAAIRSYPKKRPCHYQSDSQAFLNSALHRGCPMGGMGTGGFGVGTDGGFGDFRTNHNWMNPILSPRGHLLAIQVRDDQGRVTSRILRRRYWSGKEYVGPAPIQQTRFQGRPTDCEVIFEDDQFPVRVRMRAFSPLTPGEENDASLPVCFFDVDVQNVQTRPCSYRLLFSMENIVGRGGTGHTGVTLWNNWISGMAGKLTYTKTDEQFQRIVDHTFWTGLEFSSTEEPPSNAHLKSAFGSHFLLCERSSDNPCTVIPVWDAADDRPPVLQSFEETAPARQCKQQAGGLLFSSSLEPGTHQTHQLLYLWWMPHHIVEADLISASQKGDHKGHDIGHHYETLYASPFALASDVQNRRSELEQKSALLADLLHRSTLPSWLQQAMLASTDSLVANTLIPRDGRLYTIEGTSWGWYFGGLLGTNDQRLCAHPFTATFFPRLDKTELETFRSLHRDGEIPHGIGNCDLAVGTDDVPYGRPLEVKGALKKEPWPDLTLSWILQMARLVQTTGDAQWIDEAWSDLQSMHRHLQSCARHGVPEGGSTYDTFSFPGTFSYTATLTLAAYRVLYQWAAQREDPWADVLMEDIERVQQRIEETLWVNEHGYYRTAEGRDTLFWGSLAGVWMADRIGLAPILETETVRQHLLHQHEKLAKGQPERFRRSAFPFSEVSWSGRFQKTRMMGVFPVFSYIWQVISYHAALCIRCGLVEEGLFVIEEIFQWHMKKAGLFSSDVYGNPGAIYMSHLVHWALPEAFSGAAWDGLTHCLRLDPQRPTGQEKALYPIFFPNFYGLLHVPRKGPLILEITHTKNAETVVHTLRLGPLAKRVTLPSPWTLQAGTQWTVPEYETGAPLNLSPER